MKQFEELAIEELIRLEKPELTEYLDNDYQEGVATIKAVMNQCKEKVGYRDGLAWAHKIWKNRWAKVFVWTSQTLLLIVFFSWPWVWIAGLALGFTLALLSNMHEASVMRTCTMVRNHFEALDGITLDIVTLKLFYYQQVPDKL